MFERACLHGHMATLIDDKISNIFTWLSIVHNGKFLNKKIFFSSNLFHCNFVIYHDDRDFRKVFDDFHANVALIRSYF
jgi:hypothetical protein